MHVISDLSCSVGMVWIFGPYNCLKSALGPTPKCVNSSEATGHVNQEYIYRG